MSNGKGEHGKKTSKMESPQPMGPTVAWDFNSKARHGEVLRSEPNTMIHAFHGRAWDERAVMGAGKRNMPRRQMLKPKIPHGNGSR